MYVDTYTYTEWDIYLYLYMYTHVYGMGYIFTCRHIYSDSGTTSLKRKSFSCYKL